MYTYFRNRIHEILVHKYEVPIQIKKSKEFKNNYLEFMGNSRLLHFWLIDRQSVNHFIFITFLFRQLWLFIIQKDKTYLQ